MELRKANVDDISEVMRIFAQARLAQRAAGFRQWEDGYPSVGVLRSDINDSIGYVLDDGGRIAGYVAVASSDEEYDRHKELWNTERSYAVFHRIAISDGYRGRECPAFYSVWLSQWLAKWGMNLSVSIPALRTGPCSISSQKEDMSIWVIAILPGVRDLLTKNRYTDL